MIQKLSGIVIRETKINESDKMLTLLTEEMGTLSVCAKHITKNKNINKSAISPLCYSEFVLSGGPDVYYINQCTPIKSFYNISEDVTKFALSSYIAYITAELSPTGENYKEALRLLLNTLYTLSSSDKNVKLVKSVFELKLMTVNGYLPNVFSCTSCGKDKFPAYFDMKNLNLYCASCSVDGFEITENLMSVIRHILTCDQKKMFSFEISDALCDKLYDFSEMYILRHLTYTPKTLEYLRIFL